METYSMKVWFCPTKVSYARRKEEGGDEGERRGWPAEDDRLKGC